MADTIEDNVKQLRQQDELRRELVANVSHELGGPLSSLRGYLELLSEQEEMPPGQRREYLRTASRNAERLSRLSGELLDLSKLEAKELAPEPEAFSIAESISEEIIPHHRPLADERGMRIVCELQEDLPWVKADIALTERVLANLIGNAIRYGREGGTIVVSAAALPEKVRISVRDDGPGIAGDELPRIFDRFFRARSGAAAEGTGLGLAIVKGIVEAHGEELHVESEVGTGTVFSFTVQRAD